VIRHRFPPVLVAVAVAAASILGLLARPVVATPRSTVEYVVVAGAPGLRWDDVNPDDTPTLWALAERGSVGALAVRSARRPTCPGDGWVTLGAGNFAQRPGGLTAGECIPLRVAIHPAGTGASLPDQQAVVVHNREKLPWGAVPGALAESVRCSVAVGPGAAVAAARPYGRVDRYAPALPERAQPLLSACVLSIVDLGTVAGADPARRRNAARQVDAVLARLLAARPPESLLVVAGLSDTDTTSRLHVAIADGPGWAGGWLSSASTGRPGYLQLADLAPTALAALGEPAPRHLFAGRPADRAPGRPAALPAAVAALADADREAGAQRRVTAGFFTALAVVQLLLFLGAVPLLRRARRHTGPAARAPVPRSLSRAAEVLLVAAGLAIPAALVADAVPWWRSGAPGPVFAAVTAGILVVLTTAVTAGPWRRLTLGPLAAVAAVAGTVVAVDVLTGATLQLNGVAGYSTLEGGRYAGLGTVALGVFVAGLLLTAGCLAQRLVRRWRTPLVAVVGGVGVVLAGSPYLGADAGGAIALTAGVCIAAAMATGGWLTLGRLVWATLAGLAVTTGFALMDLRRPADERGTLGRFLTELGEGTGGMLVNRAGAANVVAFASSPLTVLALGSAMFVWLALLSHWGGLKRLFGLYPSVRAAFAGLAVASLVAGPFNAAALNVAGAAAATAVPLAALAALRVLDHADDRTVVPAGHGVVPVPAPDAPAPGLGAPAPDPAASATAGRVPAEPAVAPVGKPTAGTPAASAPAPGGAEVLP